jgi:hypothetical protein
MTCFVATYRPLVLNRAGRQAVRDHGLPRYIDGSCRREPDFQSPWPSITATCRAGNFAPRLQVGDRVMYLTVKGRYEGEGSPSWRLVALLHVIHRFATHAAAADWYRASGLPLPSNCIVPENPPRPFELTNRMPPASVRGRVGAQRDPRRAVRLWNATYRGRVARWPVFLVTAAEYLELDRPPLVTVDDLMAAFGSVPSTLTPPAIDCRGLDRLVEAVTSR